MSLMLNTNQVSESDAAHMVYTEFIEKIIDQYELRGGSTEFISYMIYFLLFRFYSTHGMDITKKLIDQFMEDLRTESEINLQDFFESEHKPS